MSSVVIAGNTSGTVTLDAPAVAGTTTLTLPATSGTVALTASPTFTGQATIPTINLTGGQITFPATAVPSADANTLDDYEEGTWTPTITFSGASVGITYLGRLGVYTKIGNVVTVTCNIELSSKGSSTGNFNVTGLPFAGNGTVRQITSNFYFQFMSATFAAGGKQSYIETGGTSLGSVQFFTGSSSSPTNITDTSFGNSSYVYFTMSYTT
jgi:hypothetical protein